MAWAACEAVAAERDARGSSIHADVRCYAEEEQALRASLGMSAGGVTWRAGAASDDAAYHRQPYQPCACAAQRAGRPYSAQQGSKAGPPDGKRRQREDA